MNNNDDENQAHDEEQEQQVPTTTLSLPSTASIMEWMMEKQQEEEQEQQQGRRSHHITLPPLPTPFNFERSQRRTRRIPTGNEMVDKMNDVMDILDEVEMILDTPEPEYNNLLFGNTSSSSRRNIPSSSSPQLSKFENCYYRKQ